MSESQSLEQWFERYAEVSLGPSPEELAGFYAESFLVAAPTGSAAFKNDNEFLRWLRQVHDFNRQTGMTGLQVRDVKAMPMGDYFTLATVEWGAYFDKIGDAPIPFEISYVLRRTEDGFRIAGYVSHEDEEEALRSHGLL